jgi:hypothetical protein
MAARAVSRPARESPAAAAAERSIILRFMDQSVPLLERQGAADEEGPRYFFICVYLRLSAANSVFAKQFGRR